MKNRFRPELWPPQRQKFDPSQWGENKLDNKVSRNIYSSDSFKIKNDVEVVLGRIESNLADLTIDYDDWRNLGFAFVHQFGEEGRIYFHRISRFNSKYDAKNVDRYYDYFLKSNGFGITIRTFFGMARDAGIDIRVYGNS